MAQEQNKSQALLGSFQTKQARTAQYSSVHNKNKSCKTKGEVSLVKKMTNYIWKPIQEGKMAKIIWGVYKIRSMLILPPFWGSKQPQLTFVQQEQMLLYYPWGSWDKLRAFGPNVLVVGHIQFTYFDSICFVSVLINKILKTQTQGRREQYFLSSSSNGSYHTWMWDGRGEVDPCPLVGRLVSKL